MAKSAARNRSPAIAERQAAKLLEKVTATMQGVGGKLGKAATAAAKRKYTIAALAALVVAGAAAQQLAKSLRAPARSSSRPAAAKRRPAKKRPRRARKAAARKAAPGPAADQA
jgi:hypothetical protein